MKVRSKVFKRKTGRGKGSWVVRLEYDDEFGRHRCVERRARGKSEAGDLRDRLSDEIQKSLGHIRTGERMTFGDLADYCEKHYYKRAEYVDGRRVAGVRSLQPARSAIAALRQHFGPRLIRTIHKNSLLDYKVKRLNTPVATKKNNGSSALAQRPRRIASVNRELTILRRMVKIALSEGWLLRDPFAGAGVISVADEEKRERILSRDEEARLLEACKDDRRIVETTRGGKPYSIEVEHRRSHLRPLIILALDTGMRRGELFKLHWNDVDFERRVIRVRGTHTKTQRERTVPLTRRAALVLTEWRQSNKKEHVFPFADVKAAFSAVRKMVGLEDLRFHDLRHTAITRMVRGGISPSEAGKVAGHTQPTTTYRYINTDMESLARIAAVLERG